MNKYFQEQFAIYSNAFSSLEKFILDKIKAIKFSRNKEIDLYVTPMEAKLGAKKTIVLAREHDKTERIIVSVPPGVKSGKKLRIKGKGIPGFLWVSPGDILLNIQIINNK